MLGLFSIITINEPENPFLNTAPLGLLLMKPELQPHLSCLFESFGSCFGANKTPGAHWAANLRVQNKLVHWGCEWCISVVGYTQKDDVFVGSNMEDGPRMYGHAANVHGDGDDDDGGDDDDDDDDSWSTM